MAGVLPSQLPLDDSKRSEVFISNYQFNTQSLYSLPADVIRNRPDVAAAEYSYKPSAVLPILDWNRLQNQVEKQKQVKAEALAQYKKTVLSAVAELKNAMTAVQNELKSYQAQNSALAKMQKVVNATAERYRSGLIDFSEFLTMEQNLLQAQTQNLNSRAQVFQNLVAYYKASGGGYLL